MWAAVEAQFRYGGITSVSRATGLSRTTIHAGVSELEHGKPVVFCRSVWGGASSGKRT